MMVKSLYILDGQELTNVDLLVAIFIEDLLNFY